MKQTAVEWLKKELAGYGSSSHLSLGWNTFDELFEQAKEMEKEQHLKTWTEGLYCETGDKQAFEQYYNETFKSE